jgi:hypothetical protein
MKPYPTQQYERSRQTTPVRCSQKLQDAAASIKQAATEGELNTTDKKLLKRMSYDVPC